MEQASREAVHTARPPELDSPAFNALYAAQAGAVWNYVRYRLGPDDADDLTADVFERAWAARGTYDPDRGSPGTWLWAIARNATTDGLRRRSRRPALVPVNDLMAAPDADGGAAVLIGLISLGDLDRDLVALRFGAGHTNRDIAALTGLSEANVAQRLHRALDALRRRMVAEGGHG